MANTSIQFYPKRKIIAANPATDELYQIDLTLSTFDLQDEESVLENTSMGGVMKKVYFYETRRWSCVTLRSSTNGEPTTEEYDMFLASVIGGERFFMQDLDSGSQDYIPMQLVTRGQKSRQAPNDVNIFVYSFTVREEVEQ